MGKQVRNSKNDSDFSDQVDMMFEEIDVDFEDFYIQFEKPKRRKSRRSRDARRLIERYWEDRELEARLDEYYYHTDD